MTRLPALAVQICAMGHEVRDLDLVEGRGPSPRVPDQQGIVDRLRKLADQVEQGQIVVDECTLFGHSKPAPPEGQWARFELTSMSFLMTYREVENAANNRS